MITINKDNKKCKFHRVHSGDRVQKSFLWKLTTLLQLYGYLVLVGVGFRSLNECLGRVKWSETSKLVKVFLFSLRFLSSKSLVFFRHEAERLEQEAKGRLERQKITDEAEAERARKELLELQAQSAAVESTGQAKAEAQSRAEAARIEGEAAVQQAKLKAEAAKIEAVSRATLLIY